MSVEVKPSNSNLVLNKASSNTTSIQALAFNFLPKLVRHDTMEGRDFLVVPMVILTEGVHAGSMGPIYYSPEELGKTPVAWNMKPIVVYHPTMNGQGISACDPIVITNRKVGVMMNTKFEGGRLKSEAWIEKDRANKVDERIMAAITANEMMEVSTGVFIDNEEKEGVWNGEDYIAIARNFRPDHLALLPDQIGACSIKDGAGFLRNTRGEGISTDMKKVREVLEKAGLLDNEMSHSNIHQALMAALKIKLNVGDNGPFIWVADVFSNFVVYEKDGKLFRLGFTATDVGVSLSDDNSVEVVRVTEYRTLNGAFVGNQENIMNKKKLVDALIANHGWTEDDRATLMALTEEQLGRVTPAPAPAPAPAAPAANTTPAPTPVPAVNTTPAPAAPAAPAPEPVTLEKYISNAPRQIQEVLQNGLSIYNEEKARLIEAIIANKANVFTKEDLSARPLNEVRAIARLAAAGTAKPIIYAGQAPVPTENAESETPMEMPTINFGK